MIIRIELVVLFLQLVFQLLLEEIFDYLRLSMEYSVTPGIKTKHSAKKNQILFLIDIVVNDRQHPPRKEFHQKHLLATGSKYHYACDLEPMAGPANIKR